MISIAAAFRAAASKRSVLFFLKSRFLKPNTDNKTAGDARWRKRSRLYQAQLDVSLLEPGTVNFNQLNDSCFILIAPFDLFGKGLYRYTFEGMCRECPELKIEDGAVRVFINTKGKNPEGFSGEFLDFMRYITETTDEAAEHTASERIKRIHREVRKVKESERMGVKYMQAWEEKALEREDGRAEGRKEGRKEGSKEALTASIQNIMETLCEGLGTTVEEYEKAKEQIRSRSTR